MYTFNKIVSTLCETCEDKEKENKQLREKNKQLREKNKQLKKLLLDIKDYIGVLYWEERINEELKTSKKE